MPKYYKEMDILHLENMKTNNIILAILFMIAPIASSAQIGYQVSLLNSATGEPRAGETVNVSITLTNSANATIYSQTQSATTNDFGILSLAIGNANTFNNVDWNKLPFFISAYVDGKLIGRSQILTVPVAEYAKKTKYAQYSGTADYAHKTGVLTKALLEGTWIGGYRDYTFDADSNCVQTFHDNPSYVNRLKYSIDGNHVYVYNNKDKEEGFVNILHYIPEIGKLGDIDWDLYGKE